MSPALPSPSRELLLRWLLAAGVFTLLIVFFSPSWGAFRLWTRVPEMSGMLEVRRGVSVLAQVAHPGAPIADELHHAIQWRLLFPLIGYAFNLPPTVFFGLAHLGCLLVLGVVITLVRRAGFAWKETALAAITLGASSWFFVSTGWLGYFDAWFALALLLVGFAEPPWIVWLACLFAPWIDERFVLAAPLALFCRSLHQPEAFQPRRDVGIPAALLAAFVCVRLGLLSGHSASGATASGYLASRNFLDAPITRIVLGLWEGLRAGWGFVFAAVFLRRSRPHLTLGLALALLAAIGVATAQDYSRAMTMLWPVAVLGVLLARAANVPWLPVALRTSAIAALLLPAHHVMNDRVNPIFNLQHELAALESPPAIAMPELYELRAIHKMGRGEFAAADADLALAIKLAVNPASPARQRGILAATQHRWSEAQRYFALSAEHDSDNPDAWLMCAQANLALNQTAAAQRDLQRALALAPVDWKTRPDVARFLSKLNSAPAGK